jgi:hypothetical protein
VHVLFSVTLRLVVKEAPLLIEKELTTGKTGERWVLTYYTTSARVTLPSLSASAPARASPVSGAD